MPVTKNYDHKVRLRLSVETVDEAHNLTLPDLTAGQATAAAA
jgi:hypothetical protein